MRDPVEALLRGYNPLVQDMALRLRELVRTALPEADERVLAGLRAIHYATPSGLQVCAIAPFRRTVHLYVPLGLQLVEPELTVFIGGNGLPVLPFVDPEQIRREALARLLRAALAVLLGP